MILTVTCNINVLSNRVQTNDAANIQPQTKEPQITMLGLISDSPSVCFVPRLTEGSGCPFHFLMWARVCELHVCIHAPGCAPTHLCGYLPWVDSCAGARMCLHVHCEQEPGMVWRERLIALVGRSSWNSKHRIDRWTDREKPGNKSERGEGKLAWSLEDGEKGGSDSRGEGKETGGGGRVGREGESSRQTNCKFFRNDVM